MRVSWFKTLMAGAVVLVTAAACDDNPVAEGRDEVARLNLDRAFASVAPGDSVILTVGPENRYQAPVGATVTATACDDKVTIGSVTPDDLTLLERHNVVVHGTNNLGFSCVEVSAGSVVDTVDILVVPPFLLTDVESAGPNERVVLTRSEGQPEFDEDVQVTFGGEQGFWLRSESTEDQLTVVIPFTAEAGATEIVVSNIGEDQATISTPFEIAGGDSSDPHEPNDFVFGGGETFTIEPPLELISYTDDEDTEDFFDFTVTEEVTYDMILDWGGASSDIDLVVYTSELSAVCVAASLAHPEHTECHLEPGDYYVRVSNFSAEGPSTYYLLMEEID